MKIGVLAVQGAFIEHERVLDRLGIGFFEIRHKKDLSQDMDGIILPGGESTVMGKLLHELDLFNDIKQKIMDGLPVLATCAGMILLAEKIEGEQTRHFATIPMTVRRNAYGRQLGSFKAEADMKGIGSMQLTFIRAPYIIEASSEAEVLGIVGQKIVAVKYGNQLAMSFHPELTEDNRVHQLFIKIVHRNMQQ